MKIYNLSINIGGGIREFTFADRAGVNIVMRDAVKNPNFWDASLEILSNGGDNLKPFFCDDFEEWDVDEGKFISN